MNIDSARLVEIVDGIPDAVVRLDATGGLVYANRCFRERFCPEGSVPASAPLEEIALPERGLDLRAWLERAAAGGAEPVRFAIQVGDAAGRRLWYDVIVSGVFAGDRFDGAQVVLRDITTLKQAEADQARMQARLFITQKYEALGTLAGGIAHDFNNILSGIVNFTTLAREECPPESERVREYLGEVLNAGQRAKELVRQIQLFRRSEGDERVPFLIQNLVREALSLLRSTLPASVEIESDLDRHAPLVLANPLQLHQAVVNLAINSVQAMREQGGRLRVTLGVQRVDPEFAQTVPALRAGEHVVLVVTDDGCGMEPEVLARVCEPYFTTRKVGEGSGLGLPVVYSTVRAHEGAIRIVSAPRAGTSVEIYLPVHRPVAVDNAPPEKMSALDTLPHGAGQHVLLVDDEAPIARSARIFLERLGYRVSMFTHPEAALAAFWSEPDAFDALVTDYQMPAMTGLELSRRVLAARPGLPVFMASGFSGHADAEALREEGITALLQKPFEIADLALHLTVLPKP